MQAALAQRTVTCRSAAFGQRVQPARTLVLAAPKAAVVVEAKNAGKSAGGKLKTRKAASKRFKLSGSGKLMARHSGKQHMNEKQTTNKKRELSQMFVLDDGNVWQAQKCLPYHKIK